MAGKATAVHNGRDKDVGPSAAPSIAAGALDDLLRRQKAGEPAGIVSVCSAHPLVLEAAVVHAQETDSSLLVEATSNQVDQDGGYTGMRPADFRELALGIAKRSGLHAGRIILGGDHLGPNRWRSLPSEQAMEHAHALVAAYVDAGFIKLHLDCTFACADDTAPLDDAIVAERAVRLIAAAEQAAGARAAQLRYVIGTEVPPPGGELETAAAVRPTTASAARGTLTAHRRALASANLTDRWSQVIALVVQPGVDFGQMDVLDYERAGTAELRRVLDDEPTMVFEAHSTDYQTVPALRALVEDHWAILKVGPALTFALREALFALSAIEAEMIAPAERARLPDVIEERMLAEPGYWRDYASGGATAERLARRYGYSDRLRYYWPDPAVEATTERLLANLDGVEIPLPLLSLGLPRQYARVRAVGLEPRPRALVLDRVRDVMRDYEAAVSGRGDKGE